MFAQDKVSGRIQRNLRGLITTKEPECEVEASLKSVSEEALSSVRYNFTTHQYEPLPDEDMFHDLLSLDDKTILKSELQHLEVMKKKMQQEEEEDVFGMLKLTREEEEEIFAGVISKEELRKLDSQYNPFNFCERVAQTNVIGVKESGMQTEPPPSTHFSMNVGLGNIYDAYEEDYKKILHREMELEREKEKEGNYKTKQPTVDPNPLETTLDTEPEKLFGEVISDMSKLIIAVRTLERMVSQNVYDEIIQDFKYWEDGSDEFRPMEGSLLPLWRFSHEESKELIVSSICWSQTYPDLFAAGFRSHDITKSEGKGMVCLFTMKNPSAPERVVSCETGITSLQFHPRYASVICAGGSNGEVFVYDLKLRNNPIQLKSNAVNGKHYLPVNQVHWISTDPGEDLSFFSVAMDKRVTQWFVHGCKLVHNDLLDFGTQANGGPTNNPFCPALPPPEDATEKEKLPLEGCGTCIAFKPEDDTVLLIGCNSGAIFQCTTMATTHDMTKYSAHNSAVTSIKWNHFNHTVFASCSIDWTIKIWGEYHLSPLIVLNIGGPCSGIEWSPKISTVLVAINDEGKVNVFDLSLKKCLPLCVQNLVQKRSLTLTYLAYSPFFPVVLVGGHAGYLVAFKLSPNLRKIHKEAKGGDEQKRREVEISKMAQLIKTGRAQM